MLVKLLQLGYLECNAGGSVVQYDKLHVVKRSVLPKDTNIAANLFSYGNTAHCQTR
ncbi:hypothetical protein SDC9_127732 [bioreactor metagenome]|uniref:Uncharacterized protein n=1 Tax=bioreactor metagenome TaxID=1076179 RepID=A0A645CVG0_9ZZZZ